MPNWSVAVALMLISFCTIEAPGIKDNKIELLDGKAVSHGELPGGAKVSFDGGAILRVQSSGRSLVIDPKTPSIVTTSIDGELLLLNYGEGSGQVFRIEIYNIRSNKKMDISSFFSKINNSNLSDCHAKEDQISYIFSKWIEKNKIEIITEDFSRSYGCDSINRSWILSI